MQLLFRTLHSIELLKSPQVGVYNRLKQRVQGESDIKGVQIAYGETYLTTQTTHVIGCFITPTLLDCFVQQCRRVAFCRVDSRYYNKILHRSSLMIRRQYSSPSVFLVESSPCVQLTKPVMPATIVHFLHKPGCISVRPCIEAKNESKSYASFLRFIRRLQRLWCCAMAVACVLCVGLLALLPSSSGPQSYGSSFDCATQPHLDV